MFEQAKVSRPTPRPSIAARATATSRFVVGQVWRAGVLCAGLAIVVIGVAMLPLPGPGTLIMALGLGVLSVEFTWARNALSKLRIAWASFRHAAADRLASKPRN